MLETGRKQGSWHMAQAAVGGLSGMRLCLLQMRAPTTRAAPSWSGARSGTQTAGGGPGRCTLTPLV